MIINKATIEQSLFFSPLQNVDDAKELLRYLYAHGLLYHCEDDACDCLRDKVTPEQAEALNDRMAEAYTFDWAPLECPCAFALRLDPEYDEHL